MRTKKTSLTIGDRNVIREFATLHRGTLQDHAETRIGNDNLFMAYTHVAHDCLIGDNVIMANGASLAGHVHVSDKRYTRWLYLSTSIYPNWYF